jgi:serine protease Do
MQTPDSRRPTLLIAAASAIIAGLTAGCGVSDAQPSPPPASPAVASGQLPDMAAIAARFAPTVVNISVTGTRKFSTAGNSATVPGEAGDDGNAAQGSDDTDAMREFLRNFQQRFGGLPPQMRLPMHGEGSGFIVRAPTASS